MCRPQEGEGSVSELTHSPFDTREPFSLTPAQWRKRREQLDRRMKKLRAELADLDRVCPHSWSYDIDPAGDSTDNGWHCSICGAFTRRNPHAR